MSEQNIGTVVQIIGPVLDIKFAADALPKLLNAITIDNNGRDRHASRLRSISATIPCAASRWSPPTAWCAA